MKLEERTKKQWVKTILVGLIIPIAFIWMMLTIVIEKHYHLLSKMTNKCDDINIKINNLCNI